MVRSVFHQPIRDSVNCSVAALVQAFIASPWIIASSALPLCSSQRLPMSIYPAAHELILAPPVHWLQTPLLGFFPPGEPHPPLAALVHAAQASKLHSPLPLYLVLPPQRMSPLPHSNPNQQLRLDSSYPPFMNFCLNYLTHTYSSRFKLSVFSSLDMM